MAYLSLCKNKIFIPHQSFTFQKETYYSSQLSQVRLHHPAYLTPEFKVYVVNSFHKYPDSPRQSNFIHKLIALCYFLGIFLRRGGTFGFSSLSYPHFASNMNSWDGNKKLYKLRVFRFWLAVCSTLLVDKKFCAQGWKWRFRWNPHWDKNLLYSTIVKGSTSLLIVVVVKLLVARYFPFDNSIHIFHCDHTFAFQFTWIIHYTSLYFLIKSFMFSPHMRV